MNFENNIPEWKNAGTEPSEELKTNGFQGGYKPPAGVFNWFWAKVSKVIKEIQDKLSNVDNTSDSEKSVKFASEAGVGRKVANAFIVRFKGGNTEGTDLWTYDGSTSRSVNITPEKIGARPTDKPNIVVNAVREEIDGKEIYTVTDSNITELYNGLEITIIPNATNTTTSPRLDINEFGDKGIRMALSFNCAATNIIKANYIQAGRPITLKYHSELNLGIQGQGAWIFADRLKVSAQDLYGSVPIESGGTDASTAEEALANLGAAPKATHNILTFDQLRQLGINDTDLSATDLAANISTIISSVGNNSMANSTHFIFMQYASTDYQPNFCKSIYAKINADVGTTYTNSQVRIEIKGTRQSFGAKNITVTVDYSGGAKIYEGIYDTSYNGKFSTFVETTPTKSIYPLILPANCYGSDFPATAVKGQLFFKK